MAGLFGDSSTASVTHHQPLASLSRQSLSPAFVASLCRLPLSPAFVASLCRQPSSPVFFACLPRLPSSPVFLACLPLLHRFVCAHVVPALLCSSRRRAVCLCKDLVFSFTCVESEFILNLLLNSVVLYLSTPKINRRTCARALLYPEGIAPELIPYLACASITINDYDE